MIAAASTTCIQPTRKRSERFLPLANRPAVPLANKSCTLGRKYRRHPGIIKSTSIPRCDFLWHIIQLYSPPSCAAPARPAQRPLTTRMPPEASTEGRMLANRPRPRCFSSRRPSTVPCYHCYRHARRGGGSPSSAADALAWCYLTAILTVASGLGQEGAGGALRSRRCSCRCHSRCRRRHRPWFRTPFPFPSR